VGGVGQLQVGVEYEQRSRRGIVDLDRRGGAYANSIVQVSVGTGKHRWAVCAV
jgi:hypothetical protein